MPDAKTLFIAGVLACLLLLVACRPTTALPSGAVVPLAAEPDKYKVELFADLAEIYPDEADPEHKLFGLTIHKGGDGFRQGLYATGGPFPPPRGTKVLKSTVSTGPATSMWLWTGSRATSRSSSRKGPPGRVCS